MRRRPIGYADIATHRDAAWLGTIINGLGFAVVGVALGPAARMLAPRRGSIWANVGAVVAGLSGLTFCAGLIAFGSFAWCATNHEAISITSWSA